MHQFIQLIKLPVIQYLCVFIMVFGLYANTIGHNYAYDDNNVIIEHVFVSKGFKGIPDILTGAYREGYLGKNVGLYRPVSLVTFAIEVGLFGKKPYMHHIFNVLYYAFTGLLLLMVLKVMLRNFHPLLPFLSCILFITHPIHTEVIANIKSRDEILSLLFLLIALHFLFCSLKSTKIEHSFNASVFFLLSLMSKESSIAFLAIVPLILYVFERSNTRTIISKSLPFYVAACMYLLLLFTIVEKLEGGEGTQAIANTIMAAETASEKWATTIMIFGKYTKLLFFPHPLICDYSSWHFRIVDWNNFYAWLSLGMHLLLLAGGIILCIKRHIAGFCILFYFITMALVSNIFIRIGWTLGERYLYVPSLGFCIIMAYFIIKSLGGINFGRKYFQLSQKRAIVVIVAILCLYSYKTISRNQDWQNNFVLFEIDSQQSPNNARLYLNIGKEHLRLAQRLTDKREASKLILTGIDAIKKSVDLYPNFSTSRLDLGSGYAMLGQYEAALASMQKGLELNPSDESIYLNIGIIYKKMGDVDNAIRYLTKVVEIVGRTSKSVKALVNLAEIYTENKMFKEAIDYGNLAIELTPKDEGVRLKTAIVYYEYGLHLTELAKSDTIQDRAAGLFQRAIGIYQKSINLYSGYVYTHHALGTVFYYLKDYDNAVNSYYKALNIDSTLSLANHNIGAIHFFKGDYDVAISFYKRAIRHDAKSIKSYYNLADCYNRKGELMKAREYLLKTIKAVPSFAGAYVNLQKIYTQEGMLDSAVYYGNKYNELIGSN